MESCPTTYQHKIECLSELEDLSERKLIDLYYADETRVNMEGYVPYGWQFADEDVFVPCEKSQGPNCFGLLSRNNEFHFSTTRSTIDSQFVIDQLGVSE